MMLSPLRIRRNLRALGLLGINERNARYTLRCNPRRLYPRADDKLLTKKLLAEGEVPTARVIATATTQHDVPELVGALREAGAFALKPAHGAMGNGILVVREYRDGRFRAAGGTWLSERDVAFHASSTISGLYALGGQPDVAFAEDLLEVHPVFLAICADGVPDLRVVCYRGVPVMAMTRLPTHLSRGRANLHQGAVGAGVDLASGLTSFALQHTTPCERHPDTGAPLIGRVLPAFERALEIAVRATDLTGLGYVGADVVVDARHGPLILELNARPGLAIQVANRAGLAPRLDAVDDTWKPGRSLEERILLGRAIAAEFAPPGAPRGTGEEGWQALAAPAEEGSSD